MKIIIFHQSVIEIGGVETFTYNMCVQLSEFYDITLLYGNCHPKQLERLKKYVICEQYNKNKEYECDLLLMATSWGENPETVKCNKVWQMIHANYKEITRTHANFIYEPWKRVNKYISVSKTVANSIKELYNLDSKVMYNIQMEKQPLRLISASRFSAEKGYKRMIILAQKLKEAKIPFEWRVYTSLNAYKINPSDYPQFKFLTPTYDLAEAIRWADYGVQLSDTEGYCYFVNECLFYGTPTITTDFDSVHESVTDGVNGYIIDMELSNLDIDKIVNHIPSKLPYKLQSTVKDWVKLIGKPEKEKKVEVIVIRNYNDLQLNKHVVIGEKFIAPVARAKHLTDKGLVEMII